MVTNVSWTTTHRSGERTAHSYAGSLYLLPSDEEERQRLSVQHQLYTRLLSDRLILPPIQLSGQDEVLDIGTGAGSWIEDVRGQLPKTVQLYGIDIEPRLFPASAPNTHFSVCSATDLPSEWSSKFSLVNQRLLIAAYTRDQWQQSIAQIYRVLKPGGYVQLIETGPQWVSGPKTAAHMLFLDEFLGKRGMLIRCSVYLADMLKAAGFVDVKSEAVTKNMGKWFGEDGIIGRDITLGAWRGMRDNVIRAGGMGRFASAEEFDEAMDGLAQEWDTTEGSHTSVTVFCGRKPL